MRIRDLELDQITIGVKIRSLRNPNKLGTIVKIDDEAGDQYSWVLWDGEEQTYSGFWWNHCDCEIVNE